jgi:tetratricopeptide (TPR) repeat protein
MDNRPDDNLPDISERDEHSVTKSGPDRNHLHAENNGPGVFGGRLSSAWPGMLCILLVTLLAYSSVFSAGFIWDDDDHVLRIEEFGTLAGLARIWFDPGATIQYYPLVFTLFWLQIKLWGLAPLGFHLVNIVIHAANAMLVRLCLTRLAIPGAFWVACIFALHPLQVESVAWITELKNILSAFFYLLAFLSYWRFACPEDDTAASADRNRGYYVAAVIFFICALLCKTVTCSLPAVILLLFWWKRGRLGLAEIVPLLPFFVVAGFLGVITLGVERNSVLAKGPEWDFTIVERLLIAGRATWFHFSKMLWPHPLIFNYPRWQLDASVWWQYLYPVSVCVTIFLLWRYREKTGRAPLAACLFILGTNFPVLGFLNVYSMRFSFVADHYYYIANIGVIVLVVSALDYSGKRLSPRFRPAVTVLIVSATVACAVMTWQYGKVFHDDLTLFNDILAKHPGSWFAYTNRAANYMARGRDDLAIADLDRSLQLRPDDADALHMQGLLFMKQKDFTRAFANFDRSISLRPWRDDYFKSRGKANILRGRLSEALSDINMVLLAASHDQDNFLLRASIYLALDNLPAALADLNRAISIDAGNADAWANRGLILYRQGLLPEAITDFDRALQLDSATAPTYFNRGLARAATGDGNGARSDLEKARDLGYRIDDGEINMILNTKVNNNHGK